jgi:hypothetical protein
MTFLDVAHMLMTIDRATTRVRNDIDHRKKHIADLSTSKDKYYQKIKATSEAALKRARERNKDLQKVRRQLEDVLRARFVEDDILTVDWPDWLTKDGKIIRPWMLEGIDYETGPR